jgi:hypothetical protein
VAAVYATTQASMVSPLRRVQRSRSLGVGVGGRLLGGVGGLGFMAGLGFRIEGQF